MHQPDCQLMPNRILRIGVRPKNFRNNPKARKIIRFTNRTCKASRSRPVLRAGGRAVENERSASRLRAHMPLREAGQANFTM
jgi:hypothetical protein